MKKRILLDEHLSERVGELFGSKDHVYLAEKSGLGGRPDTEVIDFAIKKKCLIITSDEKFVETYRTHPARRSRRGPRFFYGLIFVRAASELLRRRHIAEALAEIAWDQTRRHDDLIVISRDGRSTHERLCHPECAAEFGKG